MNRFFVILPEEGMMVSFVTSKQDVNISEIAEYLLANFEEVTEDTAFLLVGESQIPHFEDFDEWVMNNLWESVED